MKKMIVIREGGVPDSREVEDYLYNSEVTRSDFIDMSPTQEDSIYKDGLSIHASEWSIVFKGDDKYDMWHVIADIETLYAFEDRRYKALLMLEQYRSEHCTPTIVIHSPTYVVVVYRINKELSDVINRNLKQIIESFNGERYEHIVSEDDMGTVVIPEPEKEDVKDPRAIRLKDNLE